MIKQGELVTLKNYENGHWSITISDTELYQKESGKNLK